MVLSVAGETVFGDIGNTGTQHGNSHANNQQYHDGIQFIVARYAELLATLRDTPDVEGNLLDSTMVFCSSELSQGWSHSWQRQPILIGGHACGYLQYPGIHYQAIPQNNPSDDQTAAGNTSDILLTMLRAFDPAAPSVGGGAPMSTNVLSDIMA